MKINWYRLRQVGSSIFVGSIGAVVLASSLALMVPLTLNPNTWVVNILMLVGFITGCIILVVAVVDIIDV